MSKTKTPFFSMGSHGTVGGAITSQRRGSETLLRDKPVPAYRRTLLQSYQRWLYQDYALLYKDASEATRREYAIKAAPYHLTAFQMWMKEHLKDLAYISAWHRLDTDQGGISRDYSSYHWNGAITGPSPSRLAIDGAYSFDGLNDVVTIPHAPHLNIDYPFTIELFVMFKTIPFTGSDDILAKGGRGGGTSNFNIYTVNGQDDIWIGGAFNGGWASNRFIENVLQATLYHICITYDGQHLRGYRNSVPVTPWAKTGHLATNNANLTLSGPLGYPDLYLDNFIEHTRVLSQEEITRHSNRRYPLQ